MPSGTQRFDAIVVGAGAHGSAAAYHLAKRGQKVVAIDRHEPPHDLGSSGGATRIIRHAYHEGPQYVPLVERAHELWLELEKESGQRLLTQTGGLFMGGRDATAFTGALATAEERKIPHDVLDARTLKDRYPIARIPPGTQALREPRAGLLRAPECIRAHLELAVRAGATIKTGETVNSWRAEAGGVEVTTDRATYNATTLVLAAGAWLPSLAPDLGVKLQVERQVTGWFESRTDSSRYGPERFPVFIWEFSPDRVLYGLPDLGQGIKIGLHHNGARVDPDTVDRTIADTDLAPLRAFVHEHLPGLRSTPTTASVCLYTNTPDEAFLLDHHPRHPNVIVASCCSGHGFKFAPAVGEAVADLALGLKPRVDLTPFRFDRFPR